MAFKVLLGLLAAVAVTGSAVFYSHSSYDCPLAGGCSSKVAVSGSAEEEGGCAACAACSATVSRAKVACCAEAEESFAGTADAMAAATGGVSLGR